MKQFKFNERQRFSIRKFSIGAASVLLGSVFFAINSVTEVQAMEASSNTVIANDTDRDLGSVPTAKSEEVSPSSMTPEEDKNNSESGILVSPILDSNPKKQALAKLIEEIDGKISSGAYDEKTEDSVNRLKAVLEEAKATVNTATTEGELTQAHSRLVTATTQLKTKPEEKKEAPAVDTTNGKSTVGIKATNTEKASDSNSIANSGSRDERNGKALDKNRAFRTEAATTNTDPAANQTYTAPDENADLTTLADKLKNLPNVIENNKKVQDMDTLGNALNVDKGSVKEINEFGGWKAVGEKGKFAIARATDKGVFPIETVNVLSNNQAWIEEQSFDKSSKYMLFLSKVRTKANRTDESYDGSQYKESGEGGPRGAWIAKGTKGFDGIEKTFRAYNPKEGTTVKIKFKTGYTGIIEDARGSDKSRAKYKVTVFDTTDGKNNEIYSVSFDPGTNIKNNEMTVVAAKNGSGGNVRVNGTSEQAKNAALETMSQSRYKSGSGGTFESKDIVLAPGVKTYKVIISSADNLELGMSYQSSFLQYALPVTGLDYSIDQDTSAIAKNLLQRVYDKLKATEAALVEAKIAALKAKLEAAKAKLVAKADTAELSAAKADLDTKAKEVVPTEGKTKATVDAYNEAKTAAAKAVADAEAVINDENVTDKAVANALAEVKAKKAALEAAKAALVDKVTEAQKTTLGNAGTDLAVLGEAELAGKTKETADAYKAETGKLTEEIAAAKREAEAILADPENKTQAEAALVEAKIAALKAKLEAAKAKLVAKADTAELSAAKADLDTKAKEVVPTEGKTKATVDAYNEAKTAAAKAVADAEAVINDENVTDKAVANALAEVKAKKAALEAAKAALVDKVTEAQKTTLGNAGTDLAVLGEAELAGKTKETADAYKAETGKLTEEIAAAKREAEAILADPENKTQAEAALVEAKIAALKAKLEAAKAKLVAKADTAELSAAKADLDTKAKEVVPTEGKTKATVDAYNEAKTAAAKAVADAEAVINDENVTDKAVANALAEVKAKKAALEAAKAALVDKVTEAQKTTLGNAGTDLAVLGEAELAGKTKETADAYKAETGKLTEEIAAAKREAEAILADPENKTQAEAALVEAKIAALKAKLEAAKAKLVAKADTAELSAAKADLDTKAKEVVPTEGKTKATVDAYNEAKTAAAKAVADAEAVINDENVTDKAVANALAEVKAKKAALEAAKAALVDKVTEAQKTTLGNAGTDLAVLGEAELAGKTKETADAYKAETGKLTEEIAAAKREAEAILADPENKTQAEAALVEAKIAALKAKLEAAKAKLVAKADTAELSAAKADLDTKAKEVVPTEGKTKATVDAYNEAKTAAAKAVADAEAVINDENVTDKAVANALAEVKAKKAALEAAKAALVDKVTEAQKTTLGNAGTDLAVLGEAELAGKTKETADAYKAETGKLTEEIAAAKREAEAILADPENKTQAEAALVEAKIAALKAKLEAAKAKLVAKADTAELSAAKADLDTKAKEVVPTEGKTKATVDAYNEAKTAAAKAVADAEAVINDENVTDKAVANALAEVKAKKAALEAAKAALVDKVTEAQKTTLGNAGTDLAVLGEAELAGKTKETADAYKAETGKLTEEIAAAKREAEAILADPENKTQAEAALVEAKIAALKAKLEAAKAKLVAKADTAELSAAKADLDTKAKEVVPTEGKTKATVDAYNEAKTAAAKAVADAEAVINDENVTDKAVANALAEVKAKKAALEAAKAALVDKVTEAQKTTLGNAGTDLAVLGEAELAGKTKETADAYKAETGKLTEEIAAAKREAEAILADPENKTQAEAALVEAKIAALKAKLEAAKAKLVAKADTAELSAAKADLDTKAKEVVPTEGKTKATVDAYNEAKTAAAKAVADAEAVINDENVTDKAVANALAEVKAKKAALEAAKAALVDKVTEAQKTTLGNAGTDLAVLGEAELAGKTKETADAYKAETGKLTEEIAAAKREAEAILADPENKTQAEAALVEAKIAALKAKLEAAKAKLVAKADTAELSAAKADLDTKAKEVVPTEGKTKATVDAYNEAKTAAAKAVADAEAVINDENVTDKAVANALAEVKAKKAALEAAKAALVDKVTEAQKTTLGNAGTDLAVLGEAELAGKTKETADAYKAETGKLTEEIAAAKREAEAILADPENKTQAEAALVEAKIAALKAKLEAAKAKLVAKADTAELSAAKADLDTKAKEVVPTEGKTKATVDAYNEAKTAAAKAVADAEAVINDENVTDKAVANALAEVKAKKAALEAAKAALVDKVTEAQKTTLGNAGTDLAVLGEAELAGKTKETADAYKAETGKLTEEIAAAKREAEAILADPENKTQAEAALVEAKIAALKAKLEAAKAKLVAKADTAELSAAKADLDTKAKEVVPTEGKTKATVDAYNEAKTAAAKAVADAEAVINDENVTDKAVANALAEVKAKKAALEAAKAALVDKVTEAQKTTLGNAGTDLAVLGEAELAGKTKETADAYKAETGKLTEEIAAAKREAEAILADPENKTQAEAALVEAKIAALKAKLEAAKAKLVAKADTAELSAAKADLDTKAKEVVPTEGKTKATVDAYNEAKTAAAKAVADAEAVINDENVTDKAVANALAEVKAKKAALEAAKAALVDKVTEAQKTTLGNAGTDLAVLGEAELAGKTKETADAYKAETGKLTEEIAAAKREAEAILADPENKTQAEAALVEAKIAALKAKLEAAKAKLVAKADTAELSAAKADLDTKAKEVVPTEGKTKATVDAYNEAKTAAAKAVADAEAVINDENVTDKAVANALAEVKAKKAALEAAKAALVDKVTEAQKTTLGNAGTDLAVLGEAELAGKTKETADAYKAETGKLTEEIAAAKREAEAILADPENKTQAEAALVEAKIAALKAKLEAAKAKLVAKADTAELSAAKADLDTKAKEVVPTEGKTKATVDAYNEAKTAAAKAVADAEAVINDENVTDKAVANALAEVKAKKAALEAAKAALVDKITQDQKDDLANVEENLKLADTTGKTKDSIKAYNDEVAKLSDELAAAKQAAKDLVDKGDNAGELEAYRVQAKINKLKSKLAEAAKLLKDIDKSAAKKEVEDAAKNANDAIDDNADLTPEQKDVAKAKVAEEATKAIGEIDKATTEDDVTAAKNAGKFAIEKEAAKAEVEATKAAKEKVIDANDKLSDDEKQAAKDAVEEAATNAIQAIDAAQDQSTVDSAKTTGKEAVDAVNPVGKEKALEAVEKIANEKTKAIDANDKLSDKEKKVAKDSVAEEASKAAKAINDAQNQEAVDNAKNAGTAAVEAVNPVGKEKALAAIDKALAEKEKAIDANDKLSGAEKEAAKEEAKKAADEAKRAINEAKDQVAVDAKQTEGTNAVEAVNPVGKEKALDAIQKATEDKLAEIDRDDKLSDKEKAKAKAEVAKAAIDAVNAINEATDQAAVNAKQTEGIKAVSEVNPVGKDKAKAEIEKELAEKTNAIDSNPDLTDAQKADAKAKLVEEAKKAIAEIDKATTTEEVTSAKESGKLAIEKEAAKAEIEAAKAAKEKAIDANPDLTEDEKAEAKARVEEEAEAAKNAIDKATELSDIDKVTETGKDDIKKVTVTSAKEEAKKAIDEALAAKEKAIDARTDLTQEEKEAAKEAAREEAEAAKNAIDKATTLEDINKVLEDGKDNIAKINPENLKDKAKKAIDEALAAKEKAIDARTDLTQEEKEAAKNAAREEAEAAKNAIDKATTSEDINKVLEDGKDNIAKINPENLKDKAKKAIDEALAAKEKEIDARTDLLPEEKEAAKNAAREEAEAAKNAIDKATTSEDINKVLEDGKENIANINPVGAKEEAKKAVEEALANKEKELDGRTDLTSEEKVKAKELAREEAKAAKDAIDKAISIDGIEKALRPFLYQIDQDALVFDRPELDIKAALQASITGTVIAERGNAITQADIIAKLNLPETVTVMNIELPDTTTLGRKFAKVTLKLADGTQATVSVPVEVVEKSEENHQQNNTQVKPQEVSKPAAEPSKNSEQVEDGKDTPSKASEEKNSSKQTVLPNTGTADSTVAMVAAAASALLGLGLAGRRRKEDEEA